jgi:hypothetical protein
MSAPIIDRDNIAYTTFGNSKATTMQVVQQSWGKFCEQLDSLKPSHKDSSRMVKFAMFTGEKTDKDCLRTDGFMTWITGIEGDYDAGIVTSKHALELLEQHSIKGVIVTSHRHTPEKPRWRVYCPLSTAHAPDARLRLVARLNGAMGGILAGESFTLSQSYYVGRPLDGGEYKVLPTCPIDESCIDELEALDAIAIGKSAPGSSGSTGKSAVSTSSQRKEILAQLLEGEDVHGNALVLVGKWLARGWADDEIRLLMESIAPFVAEQRGPERAACLLGSELQRMIDGGRAKGYGQDRPQHHEMVTAFDEVERPAPSSSINLLEPPGLAGDICRYINLKARRPRPELYPFAALHLMALVGRERKSVYTSKLNLITLAIAPTAAGKEAGQDATKRLANGVKCSNLIHGNAGSFRDLIYNQLEGDGASLYVVDEVHSFLGSMKDKNAATYETKMEAEILTMFSTELYTFRGMEKRYLADVYKKEVSGLTKKLDDGNLDEQTARKLEALKKRYQRRVDWLEDGLPDPFFSLMGHSVAERLDSFVKTDNIDSGFIGRALIMRCPETREKLRRKPADPDEVAFLEAKIAAGLQSIQQSGEVVPADADASEYLNTAVDWYDDDEQLNHPIVGGIYARAPEHLFRVASILALCHGTITLDHAKYAHAMVQQSIEDIKHILLKAYADSDGAAVTLIKEHGRQTIHRNAKASGETLSRLRQLVEKPKGWQDMQRKEVTRHYFTELVEWMLETGELIKINDGRRERYKSKSAV